MTKGPLQDIGASVRARLLRLARERGEDFQLVLTRYEPGSGVEERDGGPIPAAQRWSADVRISRFTPAAERPCTRSSQPISTERC